MFIQGALLNVKGLSTEQFIRRVAEDATDCHFFIVDPPPGIIMSAAVEWRVVVPGGKAVSSLAAALWGAYEKFILPLREANGSAALLVQCKNRKGQFDQFILGADMVEGKVLAQRLEDCFRLLARKQAPEEVRALLHETEQSGFWERLSSKGC